MEHGLELNGELDTEIVSDVQSNFHHLANAMHEPPPSIYQVLDIQKPDTAKVVRHSTGVLDNEFVTFQLQRIVMENQQSSLVNKTVFEPVALERFINFLEPGTAESSWCVFIIGLLHSM